MPEDDIKALLDKITDTFSRLDMAAWFQCFHQPHLIVTNGGSFHSKNLTECEQLMGQVFDQLRQQGFVKSTLDYHKIKMLSESTAVVSAIWSRWNNKNEILQKFGATYFLSKIDQRWGITLLTSHKAENILLE